MAVKITFCSSEKSRLKGELECFYNPVNEISIGISNVGVSLDRDTAIKLSKHLRREIAKIEGEVVNG
jgi:hypothetical protein